MAFQINEEEASLFDMLWLLLASVIFVPIFQKIPGGKLALSFSKNLKNNAAFCKSNLGNICDFL